MVTRNSTTETLGIEVPDNYEDWGDAFLAVVAAGESGPVFTAPTRTDLEADLNDFFNMTAVDEGAADQGDIVGFAVDEGVFYVSDGAGNFPDDDTHKIDVSTAITDLVDSTDQALLDDGTNSIDDLSDLFISSEHADTKKGELTLEDALRMQAANILLQGNTLDTGTDGTIDASDGTLILPTR